jgi:hypothetical protein
MSESNGNGHYPDPLRDPVTGRVLAGSKLAVGNKGSNPAFRKTHELRRLVTEAVTDDEAKDAFRRLLDLGMGGDVPALKIVLEYLIGRPAQPIEVTSPDGSLELPVIVSVILAAVGDDQVMRERIAQAFKTMGRLGTE